MPINETSFAYAVGRIRVLETRLLDKSRLERMIEASGPDDALKVLAESDYAGAVAELSGVHDFEKMLRQEIGRTFALLEQICPQPGLMEIMARRYDAHNLKVLFKAKYLASKADNLLMPVGTVPPDKLQAAVAEEDFRDLPEALRRGAERVTAEFAAGGDPQAIDLILDRALYEQLAAEAGAAKVSFLEGFFVRQIDLTNLKTFIRVKRIGRDREFLKRVLLPGGLLATRLFTDMLEEPLDLLVSRLAMSEYAGVVGEGVRVWQEKGTLTRLEKLADDYLTVYLQQGKLVPFGPNPLFGYLWAKEIEVKNIRLILAGKINRLPNAAIRERVRDVYV